jgi:transposase-like protein
MNKTEKSPLEKEAIIAEYLLGNATYRELGKKYSIDFRIIHSWVMKFQGKQKRSVKNTPTPTKNVDNKESAASLELQEELRKEKLRTELLNTIIDIAEKDFKISIRKKFGTKQ